MYLTTELELADGEVAFLDFLAIPDSDGVYNQFALRSDIATGYQIDGQQITTELDFVKLNPSNPFHAQLSEQLTDRVSKIDYMDGRLELAELLKMGPGAMGLDGEREFGRPSLQIMVPVVSDLAGLPIDRSDVQAQVGNNILLYHQVSKLQEQIDGMIQQDRFVLQVDRLPQNSIHGFEYSSVSGVLRNSYHIHAQSKLGDSLSHELSHGLHAPYRGAAPTLDSNGQVASTAELSPVDRTVLEHFGTFDLGLSDYTVNHTYFDKVIRPMYPAAESNPSAMATELLAWHVEMFNWMVHNRANETNPFVVDLSDNRPPTQEQCSVPMGTRRIQSGNYPRQHPVVVVGERPTARVYPSTTRSPLRRHQLEH